MDAVRKRAERGTLKREKGEDGTVYVLLDSTQTGRQSNGDETATGQRLVAVLEDQVEHLKRELEARNDELRRKDAILLTLAQRVPELEASQNGQEDVQEPPYGAGGVDMEEPERSVRSRSWWRRLIGG